MTGHHRVHPHLPPPDSRPPLCQGHDPIMRQWSI